MLAKWRKVFYSTCELATCLKILRIKKQNGYNFFWCLFLQGVQCIWREYQNRPWKEHRENQKKKSCDFFYLLILGNFPSTWRKTSEDDGINLARKVLVTRNNTHAFCFWRHRLYCCDPLLCRSINKMRCHVAINVLTFLKSFFITFSVNEDLKKVSSVVIKFYVDLNICSGSLIEAVKSGGQLFVSCIFSRFARFVSLVDAAKDFVSLKT